MKSYMPTLFSNDKFDNIQNNILVFEFTNKDENKIEDNKKIIARSFRTSKKNKSPFFIIQKDNEIIVSVKYKRRYKYLSINEIASLLVSNNKFSKLIEGKLTDNLLKINGEKCEKSDDAPTIDLSNGLLINDSIESTLKMIINTLNHLYKINKNPYLLIKKMGEEHGIFRFKIVKKKMSSNLATRLLKRVSNKKTSKIGDKKIVDKEIISKGEIKIHFDDESFFIMKKNNEGVKTSIITHDKPTVPLEKMVIFEKEVENFIDDNSEEFVDKHFSGKGFFKYVIFSLIIAAIFVFVFKIIYQTSSSMSLYSLAGNIVNDTNRGIGLLVFGGTFFARLIGSGQLKRMMMVQGEKVSMRHVFISNLMGSVISFITPFAVGGDAIGYGYLRRKGFKRGPLAAAFISDTLLYQARFTVQTVILISFGLPIYKEIFSSNAPEAHGALIMFIVGASGTIFATIMIFSLVLGRAFQEWIIKTAIKLLEGTRFVNIYDPSGLIANYQYEFKQMRNGMKVVWGKWGLPLELFTYAMIPLFFNPFTLVLFLNGTISGKVSGVNGYMAAIVIDDLVSTANSMSITPGGSGTGEGLSITTKQFIYGTKSNGAISTKDIASSVDFAYKMLYAGPGLTFSIISIPTIILLENRRRTIGKMNKNLILNNKEGNKKTKLKRYLSISWAIFGILFITYFFLIFSNL